MSGDAPTNQSKQSERHADEIAAARTFGVALRCATRDLRQVPDALTPALDAQLLLAAVSGTTRVSVVAYPERPLSPDRARDLAALVARRVRGEPVAYLTGHRTFFGLDLLVNCSVLIPRPETELLVEAALIEIRSRLAAAPATVPLVADIGTGSGAIAIAVAATEPRLTRMYATDISVEALALAAENCRRTGVALRVVLLRGDLLAPLPEPVDLLLANLPYVPENDAPSLPRDVRDFEPAVALLSADLGLAHLRRFFTQSPSCLRPGATVMVEFGAGQAHAVAAFAREALPGADVLIGSDYAGWERFAIIRSA